MGKGNWLNKEREFDRHASDIDRSIRKNKGKKTVDKDSLDYQMSEMERRLEDRFEDLYPRFSGWEMKFDEISNWNVGRLCQELRDYYGYNETPQQAYKMIKGYWERQVKPTAAWRDIRDNILGWK